MSQVHLVPVPSQKVCEYEAPGHTTRTLNLIFLMETEPVQIRVLAVDGQAITFATTGGVSTWYHHDGDRLSALTSNWPQAMGVLPGSTILVTQSHPDDEYGGQTFFTVCSPEPLMRCTLAPYRPA